jgi:hypothetical protein
MRATAAALTILYRNILPRAAVRDGPAKPRSSIADVERPESPAQPGSSDRPLSVEIGAGRLAAESYK